MILNNGFEDNFNNWETIGETQVVTADFGIEPVQGEQMAFLSTAFEEVIGLDENFEAVVGGSAVTAEFISNFPNLPEFLGLPSGFIGGRSLQSIVDEFSAGLIGEDDPQPIPFEGSAIQQTFTANGGDLLSFDWNFLTNEAVGESAIADNTFPFFNDFAFVSVRTEGEVIFLEPLADTQSNFSDTDPDDFFGKTTGFNEFAFVVPETGEYTLGLGVVDVSIDETGERVSGLLVDDVAVDEINPELVFGSDLADSLEIGVDFTGRQNLLFTGPQPDFVDTSLVESNPALTFGNRVYAGSDDDEIIVGNRDRAFGGNGIDDLTALGDNNRLYGGAADDQLTVVDGANNRLFGGENDDTLDASAGSGSNRLYGNNGNDLLLAGANDTLVGGMGDDLLFNNGAGGNTFTGGANADQFWIVNTNLDIITEITTITDFELGTDVIGLGGAGVSDFSALTVTEDNGDSLIALNGQDLALVNNVTGLGAANFAFA